MSTVDTAPAVHPAPPVSSGIHRLFVANLVCQAGIVVTGGIVRLTGSGLGCPTWPECVPGSFVPVREQEQGYHKLIEFGNRLLTFVVLALALAVVVVVYRRLRHRRTLRAPAWGVLGGVLGQAVIGGITVVTSLSPVSVGLHFLVSAALVAVSTYLLVRVHESDDAPGALVPRVGQIAAYAAAGVLVLVLALGTVVTGSGPHAGDADKPVRYGFDPRVISWLHADAVMLFCGLTLGMWVLVAALRLPTRTVRAWGGVVAVTALQGVVGYLQFATGLPAPLVVVHMALACCLVAAMTYAVMTLRERATSR